MKIAAAAVGDRLLAGFIDAPVIEPLKAIEFWEVKRII
jgi:hypothetical protein